MPRYVVSQDTEDGPLLTNPLGGVAIFLEYNDAARAAQRAPKGSRRWIHNTSPLAYYEGKSEPENEECSPSST